MHANGFSGPMHANGFSGPQSFVSASSIAEICGIPRQTVRRKLAVLRLKGWIELIGDHSFQLKVAGGRITAKQDLGGLNNSAVGRLAQLFAKLEKIAPARSDAGRIHG
jgi:hypothetical protein